MFEKKTVKLQKHKKFIKFKKIKNDNKSSPFAQGVIDKQNIIHQKWLQDIKQFV